MARSLTTILLALAVGAATLGAQGSTRQPAAQTTAAVVDLNTATAAQLETLPGIGKATAGRIIEYRDKNGGFSKIEELMNVRGIGEKVFLTLKPLITVSPARKERASQK